MIAVVKQRINEFLAPRLAGATLDEDDDIFTVAHVNSLFAVQLLRFVEQEFAVVLDPEDMEFDNFRTVRGISDLIERKQPAMG